MRNAARVCVQRVDPDSLRFKGLQGFVVVVDGMRADFCVEADALQGVGMDERVRRPFPGGHIAGQGI